MRKSFIQKKFPSDVSLKKSLIQKYSHWEKFSFEKVSLKKSLLQKKIYWEKVVFRKKFIEKKFASEKVSLRKTFIKKKSASEKFSSEKAPLHNSFIPVPTPLSRICSVLLACGKVFLLTRSPKALLSCSIHTQILTIIQLASACVICVKKSPRKEMCKFTRSCNS